MPRALLLVVVLLLFSVSRAQFPVSVDSVYTFIRYNSILRKSANWAGVDSTFRAQLLQAGSLKDTMNCFVTVLRKLNDVHSQIFLNQEFYGHYPVFDDTTLAWLKPLNDRAISGTNQIRTAVLAGRVGYIRVPSMQVADSRQLNSLAQSLADSIRILSGRAKRGFILDLRLNGGGNIYPMLTGLSALLGNRTIAYETDADDRVVRTWEIKKGNFVIGGYPTTRLTLKPVRKASSIPVAILIGPVTKSAGSMTAIAFKGRPNTVFIGEPTADGYTTSNNYFQFAPNLTLNFATHYVADRNRHIYKTVVAPDMLISRGDHFEDLTADSKIQAAIRWLLGR